LRCTTTGRISNEDQAFRVRLSILQHHPVEGPGRIADWARRRHIEIDLYDATRGELPAGTGPVVLLGGPASTRDPPPWMVVEQTWLQQVVLSRTPVLGICLGAQLLAIAAGGRVQRMAAPELGWTPVEIDGVGVLDALQWHEDHILPPPMARIEAATAQCVQIFSLDESRIGVQFHPEWDDVSLRALHTGFDGCPLPSPGDVDRHSSMDRWFGQLMERWSKSWRAN
jgi:GMP synthase-like glutamine amidotransferase